MAKQPNTTSSKKIDRAAVMHAAWEECRKRRTFNGKFCFGHAGRKAFASALKKAWHDAKEAAGLLTADEIARDKRAEAIRAEIDALKYKSFRYDIVARRSRLEAELTALAA